MDNKGEIKKFNVVVTRDDGFISKIIQFFMGGYSHVFMSFGENVIFHADAGKVRFDTLENLCKNSPNMVAHVLKPKFNFNRKYAHSKCMELDNSPYDTLNAIARLYYKIAWYFGIRRYNPSKFDSSTQYICSVLIPFIFGITWVRPRVNPSQLVPEDYLAPDSEFEYDYSFKWNSKLEYFEYYVDEDLKNGSN